MLADGDALRADTPEGMVLLRRRGDVLELVVNGVFAMDSAEVTSELALADACGTPPGRVLVGGLGLGYTAARLLDRGATHVDVVELAGPLLAWAREGVTDQLARVASDERIALHQADIAAFVATHDGPWDAIALDVDNGPSFLIHTTNERVYSPAMLATFFSRLAPGGVLLVWCEQPTTTLWNTLKALDADASETLLPVFRAPDRTFLYALYSARRPR